VIELRCDQKTLEIAFETCGADWQNTFHDALVAHAIVKALDEFIANPHGMLNNANLSERYSAVYSRAASILEHEFGVKP
jgi:hypothetical protein